MNRDGLIVWLNDAARELVGDATGRHFTLVVAPESRSSSSTAFSRNVLGAEPTSRPTTLVTKAGMKVDVEISAAPIDDGGNVVGVFGAVTVPAETEPRRLQTSDLTPRQAETLRLLAAGASTGDIAEAFGVSRETVRNHVRGVLRSLGAHSRLEAVVTARERGLL